MHLVRASDLMGKELQDKSGTQIGQIEDVVIGLKDGQLKNLVIDVKDAGQATVQPRSLSSGTGDRLVLGMSADQVRQQARTPASGSDGRMRPGGRDAGAGATTRSTPEGGVTGGPLTGAETDKQPTRNK
jgi:sporulation protein YlmC with PRC-barrel domain